MKQIMVAVGAVVEDDEGRVLLVKHVPEKGGFWQGKWICPGGGLEFGEGIEEGIKREIKEETNLDIELIKPLLPFERIVKEEGKEMHVVYIDYLARVKGGELKVGSDVREAIWVRKGDLFQIRDEVHEDTKILLQRIGVRI
jgi:ADP-ribose pyrophosphatase YjhB (NUDIX family)